ncbi:hypothetical protein V8C35DRAFT_286721 [Trichoderma chlorosporum]
MLVHAHIASKAPGTILQAPRPKPVPTRDGSAGVFVPFGLVSVSLPLAGETDESQHPYASCFSATISTCVRPKGKPSPRASCKHSHRHDNAAGGRDNAGNGDHSWIQSPSTINAFVH